MNPPSSVLDLIGRTPLVHLARIGAGLPVPLLGKCDFLNPGGSVKDRIARAILDDAEARGVLRPGATLIEATAGNTGVGLALVAAVRGYRLVCVMPEKMSLDKRAALAALGAAIVITPNAPPHDPRNFQNVARRLAEEHGWFLTEQFANPANPAVHEATTGPEVLEQTAGRIGAFVAGAGTGGTLTGVGRFLKARVPGVRIVLADPAGSRLAHRVSAQLPDHDAPYQVEGIGGSVVPANLDLSVIDEAVLVSDEESFAMTGRLLREEGLLVGGSSGTAVVAALRVAGRGNLAGPVVVLLADSWDRYYSKSWMQRLAEEGLARGAMLSGARQAPSKEGLTRRHADDEEDTIPCPYCGRAIYEDAPACPHCGNYISEEDGAPGQKPWWLIVGALVCLAILLMWVLRG